jgi:hypothetical protein
MPNPSKFRIHPMTRLTEIQDVLLTSVKYEYKLAFFLTLDKLGFGMNVYEVPLLMSILLSRSLRKKSIWKSATHLLGSSWLHRKSGKTFQNICGNYFVHCTLVKRKQWRGLQFDSCRKFKKKITKGRLYNKFYKRFSYVAGSVVPYSKTLQQNIIT